MTQLELAQSPLLSQRLDRHFLVRAVALLAAALVLLAMWLLPPLYVLAALLAVVALVTTIWYPVAGFCLLAFSVPWGSGLSVRLGSFPISSTEVIIAVVALVWLTRRAQHERLFVRLWTPYILLFIGVLVLSALPATDMHASEREILKWAELAVVFWAASSLIQSRLQLRLLIAALVAAGVSQALLGYAQVVLTAGPAAFVTHAELLRAYGSFDQPNPYAGYLNMVLPLALAMGLLVRGQERFWYRLAAISIFGAVLASQSRGGLLAGLLAIAVVLAFVSRPLWRLFLAGIWALLASFWLAAYGLVPLGPFQRVLSVIGLGSVSFGNVNNANFSAVERAAHWLAGLRMFAAHPILGVGIGNYDVAYPAYHPRGWYAPLEHAHNYYINIAAEAGVLGLAAYVLLIGSAGWYSCAAICRLRKPMYRAAVLGVIGALVAIGFHNLFDVLYVHGMVALLGLLMALIPICLRLERVDSRQSVPS